MCRHSRVESARAKPEEKARRGAISCLGRRWLLSQPASQPMRAPAAVHAEEAETRRSRSRPLGEAGAVNSTRLLWATDTASTANHIAARHRRGPNWDAGRPKGNRGWVGTFPDSPACRRYLMRRRNSVYSTMYRVLALRYRDMHFIVKKSNLARRKSKKKKTSQKR